MKTYAKVKNVVDASEYENRFAGRNFMDSVHVPYLESIFVLCHEYGNKGWEAVIFRQWEVDGKIDEVYRSANASSKTHLSIIVGVAFREDTDLYKEDFSHLGFCDLKVDKYGRRNVEFNFRKASFKKSVAEAGVVVRFKNHKTAPTLILLHEKRRERPSYADLGIWGWTYSAAWEVTEKNVQHVDTSNLSKEKVASIIDECGFGKVCVGGIKYSDTKYEYVDRF